jgi:hypothetical protein
MRLQLIEDHELIMKVTMTMKDLMRKFPYKVWNMSRLFHANVFTSS